MSSDAGLSGTGGYFIHSLLSFAWGASQRSLSHSLFQPQQLTWSIRGRAVVCPAHSYFRDWASQPVVQEEAGWDLPVIPVPASPYEEYIRKWGDRSSNETFHSYSRPSSLHTWLDLGLDHIPGLRRASSCSCRLQVELKIAVLPAFPSRRHRGECYNGAGFVKGFHLLRNSPFCDFHACPLIPLSVSGGKQNHQQSWFVSLKIFFSVLKQNPLLTASCSCLHRLKRFGSWFFLHTFLISEFSLVVATHCCFS